MDEARFWKIIDSTRQQARRRKRAPLKEIIRVHERTLAAALRRLTREEIAAFNERFWHFHHHAYRWKLWAAAYWLYGGCSNDSFTDFRACLISLGKRRYFLVLEDPDALADLVDRPDVGFLCAEGFQYVAGQVYEKKTGQLIPLPESNQRGPVMPRGRRINHDDRRIMRRHFPKLVAKFPDMGD